MRKRTAVLVLASEDEEEEHEAPVCAAPRGRVSSRPRSRSASTARKRPRGRGSKKEPASASRAVHAVDFDMLSEEFCEHLHNVSITKGATQTKKKELWTEKHKPHSLAELSVHKKKVEEVKRWIEERMNTTKERISDCVLITGQSGVGKSTVIHVIASLLGAELCEWMTPTPTLWIEHVHNSNSGVQYMSKLDEFENFVEKIRNYSLLHPACMGESKKPIILLIDDIPGTNGRVAFARLKKCFKTLVQSAKLPTVISITEYHKIENSDSGTEYWEGLESFIEQAGAYKVAFNPITENSIKKKLTRICQEEKCDVPAQWIDHIARVSGGDIRHAITSLQYCCLKTEESFHIRTSTLNVSHCELDSGNPVLLSTSSSGDGQINPQISLPWGRDEKITLFHALGKFLHNKRETEHAFAMAPDPFALRERFVRNPLKMDTPEEVISQAHGQARVITDYLHENVLDFVSDEAIENAWLVTSYLSDADNILASTLHLRSRRITETHESDNIRQLSAASVAVRGVLFGNSHPSPSRWHSIRTPKLWQIEQTIRHNKVCILPERFEAYNTYSFCSLMSVTNEYRPANKFLCSQTYVGVNMHGCISENFHSADDTDCSDENMKGNRSKESDEDDIEDW
ncbi:cell cycle checkpoint protein RAD17 isoform X1 [Canna indica]|uniref:Cell cycle checkpoint protein RAD17 isoform X1 n=1 Tax=Canna indica TaxID=4628 RepID=A0AAQ3QDY4_9LILI|nr:cell cycle checkpoint protein RAD17 isoform X1 [Canna indica]